MHIIVDGYNLIRQSDVLRRHERIASKPGEGPRPRSCRLRGARTPDHRRLRRLGGRIAEEERDLAGGVEIIYSRLGEKADEVIKRLVEAGGERPWSSPPTGRSPFAERRGKTAIASPVFAAPRPDRRRAPVRTRRPVGGGGGETRPPQRRRARPGGSPSRSGRRWPGSGNYDSAGSCRCQILDNSPHPYYSATLGSELKCGLPFELFLKL